MRLYPIKHARASARKVESAYHYVLFELEKDRGKITTKRVDGSILEQVGFAKTNLWSDDGPNLAASIPSEKDSSAPNADLNPTNLPTGPTDADRSGSGIYVVLGIALAIAVALLVMRKNKNK